MVIINSVNDAGKFFDTIRMEFKSTITDLTVENSYDKNDLEDIYNYIRVYPEQGKENMINGIKKGNIFHIPEDDFILKLVNQFEENIKGQGLFRSLLLFNSNQVLKEIVNRIKQNRYRYSD